MLHLQTVIHSIEDLSPLEDGFYAFFLTEGDYDRSPITKEDTLCFFKAYNPDTKALTFVDYRFVSSRSMLADLYTFVTNSVISDEDRKRIAEEESNLTLFEVGPFCNCLFEH